EQERIDRDPLMHRRRHVVDPGGALEAADGLELIADFCTLKALARFDGLGSEHDAVPASRSPVRVAVLVLCLPGAQELGDFGLHDAVRQGVVNLRGRGNEEEPIAEHLGDRTEHREVLDAREHQHVETELFDVLRRGERGSAEADLEYGARPAAFILLICTLRSASSCLYCSMPTSSSP